jgi:protein-S-isoprenylcysteine O-methyltransferase Ste14
MLVWAAKVVGFVLLAGACLFLSYGDLTWPQAWVYMGVAVACQAVAGGILVSVNPDVILERADASTDVKAWDKVIVGLINSVGTVGTWVAAGLDERFRWTGTLPRATQIVGLVFLVLGWGVFYWAMASNRFFSGLVRVQEDRGHTVAASGPYRYVRHPGYVGFITFSLAMPLALGSLWALVPAGLVFVLVLIRTALEDRALHDELGGYRDYARRVRYRLLPGVW